MRRLVSGEDCGEDRYLGGEDCGEDALDDFPSSAGVVNTEHGADRREDSSARFITRHGVAGEGEPEVSSGRRVGLGACSLGLSDVQEAIGLRAQESPSNRRDHLSPAGESVSLFAE